MKYTVCQVANTQKDFRSLERCQLSLSIILFQLISIKLTTICNNIVFTTL